MTDLIQLSDVEIAAVSGGAQSIYISASQSNSSSVTQSASASNYGAVSATARVMALCGGGRGKIQQLQWCRRPM